MNAPSDTILILEDEVAHAEALRRVLEAARPGDGIRTVATLGEYRREVAEAPPTLALVDLNLPDGRAMEILTPPAEAGHFPILVMTSHGNEETAVEAIKAGALDYVVKSAETFADIPRIVARALREWSLLQERRRTEAALRESNRMLASVANTSPALMWMSGPDKERIWFNEPWLTFTGRTLEHELGEGWLLDIHPDDRNQYMTAYMTSFDALEPFSIEYRLRRADDTYRWMLDRGQPLFDDGRFSGYIGSLLDVTLMKDVEEELRRSLEEKDVLFREVHHRVKNNLQIICSLISLKIHDEQDSSIREALQDTLSRIRSMGLIHEHLYRQSSLAALSMRSYTMGLTGHLQCLYSSVSGDISVQFRIPENLEINLDRAICCGLILNELVTNVFKHAFPSEKGSWKDATLRISLEETTPETIRLAVSDNGIGLPSGLDPDVPATLGLRIVTALTRQLGGSLRLEAGPGCTVAVEFPAKK